jgi:hypothetical protein
LEVEQLLFIQIGGTGEEEHGLINFSWFVQETGVPLWKRKKNMIFIART